MTELWNWWHYCLKCNKSYTQVQLKTNPEKQHEKIMKCPKCHNIFKLLEVTVQDGQGIQETGQAAFKCGMIDQTPDQIRVEKWTKCNKTFKNDNTLKIHQRKMHPQTWIKKVAFSLSDPHWFKTFQPGPMKCFASDEEASRVFRKAKLKQRVVVDNSTTLSMIDAVLSAQAVFEPFISCPLCEKRFKDNQLGRITLQVHRKYSENIILNCK